MVLSSWESHCESSPGSFDECRLSAGWPPTLRPSQSTSTVSPPEMAATIRIHHHHLLLFSPKADTQFYHPTEGRRLSRPSRPKNGLWRPNVDVDASSTWTACCDLDLQNLIRSSVGAGKYSPSVLSKLSYAFVRYHRNNICPDEGTNEQTDEWTNAKPTPNHMQQSWLRYNLIVYSFIHAQHNA